MAVVVRRATRSDAAKVAEFAVALFELHAAWNPKRFTQIATGPGAEKYYGDRIEAERAAIFVAENDGEVVGFAYMEYEPIIYSELATKAAWLHDIFVMPGGRGAGAGKMLLAAVKDEARSFGANKVLLNVAVENADGRRLFENNGFEMTMYEMMLAVD